MLKITKEQVMEYFTDGTRAFVLTKKGIDYVEKQLSSKKEEPIKL